MEVSFREQTRSSVNLITDSIITQARDECKTYSEVSRFLAIRKQESVFHNDYVLTALLEEVTTYFEKEKSGLPLK